VPPTRGSKYPPINLSPKQAAPANTATLQQASPKPVTGFDPKTSKEVPAQRARNAQTYANTDGSETTAFSIAPVNYQDSRGIWQPITPTVVADSRALGGAGGFASAGGAAASEFAAQLGGPRLASLKLDDAHEVAWDLQTAGRAKATVQGATVRYAGIATGTDLELAAQSTGLKETIILGSREAGRGFSFPLSLKGLSAKLDAAVMSC